MAKQGKFHLTYDNVLVKWVEKQTKTDGGIYLPTQQSSVKRPLQGTVVAIGPHVAESMKMKPLLKVGDKVLFEQFAGAPVELGGRDYLLMTAQDIVLVFEE